MDSSVRAEPEGEKKMGFYTDKISLTKPSTLEEAVAKAKNKPTARSLDEILADIDAKNKGITKVAAAAPAAPVAAPKVEAPKVEAPKIEKTAAVVPATVKVAETKTAGELPEALKEHQFKAKGEEEKKPEGEKKEEKKDDKKDEKKEKEKECAKCAEKKPLVLKVAKSLDFRQWTAEDVIHAWKQHGSLENCVKNVSKLASDAKVYCALLKTASSEATKFVKVAAPEKKVEKVAEKSAFKKIAKLTDEERARLAKYFGELYGSDYVEAMLADY